MPKGSLVFLAVLPLFSAACGGGAVSGDASRGQALFNQTTIGPNNAPGCTTCHSLTPGEVKVGPSLAGVATHAGEMINDPIYTGKARTAGEYLRESIVSPDIFVHEGRPGVMYPNYGRDLSEQEIADLVAFLKTLK